MKGSTSVLVKTALLILVVVTGTTSSAATAPAREGIPREPDLRACRHLGPFFYSPALRVKALGCEDDVFMDREIPEGDFRATPSPAAGHRQTFRGAAGRGDLEMEAGSRNRIRLGFRRDFTPSACLGNIYFRNDAAEASWVRELTSRVAAEAGLARGRAIYPSHYSDGLLGHPPVLAIRAGRWRRESNVDGEERSRIVIDRNVSIPL